VIIVTHARLHDLTHDLLVPVLWEWKWRCSGCQAANMLVLTVGVLTISWLKLKPLLTGQPASYLPKYEYIYLMIPKKYVLSSWCSVDAEICR
jgi:hypothetical protein